ncbi:hypothetical protein J2X69_001338 [Algoriphagus sp. 4150]|nr:hypothetical protein [Algoriphagus sp. 4150]
MKYLVGVWHEGFGGNCKAEVIEMLKDKFPEVFPMY